jgi:hypothetical protein
MRQRLCFVLLILFCGRLSAAAAQECSGSDPVLSRTSLTLKGAHLEQDAVFYGEFELVNFDAKASLTISGYKKDDGFHVSRPEITVQFMDLRGQWQPVFELPAIFERRPDHLIVRPNSKVRFVTLLMKRDIANLSNSDFRIVLQASEPKICIVSNTFRAVPIRKQVDGFVTNSESSPN